MEIKVLVENVTGSSNLKSRHGLCLYIETQAHKMLFDLGPDRLFLENAERLGVRISDIDAVIISHGHKDHGGGLKAFLEHNNTAKIYIQRLAFDAHYIDVFKFKFYVGLDASLKNNDRIIYTDRHFMIDDELQLFSGITEQEFCAQSNSALFSKSCGKYKNDEFLHEQYLIVKEGSQNVLISGCAHNGITNILSEAERLCGTEIDAVISGFHLYNPVSRKTENEELITAIAKKLKEKRSKFFTCHCTGQKPFNILKALMGEQINYISTGSHQDIFEQI